MSRDQLIGTAIKMYNEVRYTIAAVSFIIGFISSHIFTKNMSKEKEESRKRETAI